MHFDWFFLMIYWRTDAYMTSPLTTFASLLYKTNRFHVAVRLFSNRSQMTSKCGKNISDTLGCSSCATFLFLPHFDVIDDLLLNRRTAIWNLSTLLSFSSRFLRDLQQNRAQSRLLYLLNTNVPLHFNVLVSDDISI